jgi:Zn finger protein HypA/HybF involved in hydrogenase expression
MKEYYHKDKLEQIVRESYSFAEVLRKIGLRDVGSNFKTIKKYIGKYNIDTSHFRGQTWNKGMSYTDYAAYNKLENILKENTNFNSDVLKYRLVKEGLKQWKCEKCGNEGIWEGKKLVLEVHHINGVNTDNRLENLQLLCPNCHAQTDHYRGKNLKSFKNDLANQKYKDFIEGKFDVYNIDSSINNKNKNDKSKHNEPKRFCKCCGKELNRKQLYFCSIKCASEFYSIIPDIDSLINAFKKYKNFSQVAKHFDVSDNAVRKWTNKYNITNDMKKYRYS